MLPLYHAERFQSACRTVGCHAERFQCVNRGLKKDCIVVDDQDLHRIKHHIFSLPIRNGKIQYDGECRSFSLLALTVDGAFHQIDHLLCDRKTKPCSLNAVHPTVRLAGKRFIHGCHILRTHADSGIGYDVGQSHTAGFLAFFLTHVHADTAAGFRVFQGIGKDIDIDLIQPKPVGIKILLLHPADTEIEFDVLFFDHRPGQVYEVFHRLNDGERLRTEAQLAALNLGDVQNVVNQGEQMIAGQRDLPQVFSHRFHIAEILFRNRREADDCVHRRANIVRHRREEIGFRSVRRRRFTGSSLELLVIRKHDGEVKHKQDQESCGNKADQQPVFGIHTQVLLR